MRRLIVLVLTFAVATPGATQSLSNAPTLYGPPITVGDALELIDRGMVQSTADGMQMAFAVVEPSGELVAFARMDGVPYASIRIAQQKARTAARLRMATSQLEERVQGGRTALLSSDEVIAVGGGVPIVADGRIIGALGVSGATAAEDDALATALISGR